LLATTVALAQGSPQTRFESPAQSSSRPKSAFSAEVSFGIKAFGQDLMSQLVNGMPSENVIISPLTVHMLLSMLYLGSPRTSNTSSQIKKGLSLGARDKDLSSYSHLAETYDRVSDNRTSGSTLRIANAMFVKQGVTINPSYQELAKNYYSASVNEFRSPSDGVSQLNKFVNNKTNGLIDKIAGPNDVHPNTLLILASACYFKSDWQKAFDKGKTEPMNFTLADGQKIKVEKGMRNEGTETFKTAGANGYRVLELPYKNPNYNMYIGLPGQNTLEAINDLASKFDYSQFKRKLRARKVFVQMPAFETGSTLKLNEPLIAMGMVNMFGPRADFSNMSNVPTEVEKVAHKTVVKVNEEGSEAAAVAVSFNSFRSSGPIIQSEEFIVDRPFAFMIHDREHGIPIFVGRMVNPK